MTKSQAAHPSQVRPVGFAPCGACVETPAWLDLASTRPRYFHASLHKVLQRRRVVSTQQGPSRQGQAANNSLAQCEKKGEDVRRRSERQGSSQRKQREMLFCLLGSPQRDQPWAGQLLKASRVTLRFHHILENFTVLRSVQLGPAPKNEEGKKSGKIRDSGGLMNA